MPRSSKLEVGAFSGRVIYYILFVMLSFFGSILSPAFFAFHQLQITDNNELLSRVITAVTLNASSLLWVAILGIILIYLHGLVGFLIFRGVFASNYLFCDTLFDCTLTLFREGLIYRITRIDTVKAHNDVYQYKLIYDMSFFVLILTVGLNVIFGIIVDTFRQLRDEKWRTEQDMESRCFICGRNGYEFEQKGVSFKLHLEDEHNMIAYIFFLVKADDTPGKHLTALEMYILDMVSKENYNFFPVLRAISIDGIVVRDPTLERHNLLLGQLEAINEHVTRQEREAQSDEQAGGERQSRPLVRRVSESERLEQLTDNLRRRKESTAIPKAAAAIPQRVVPPPLPERTAANNINIRAAANDAPPLTPAAVRLQINASAEKQTSKKQVTGNKQGASTSRRTPRDQSR